MSLTILVDSVHKPGHEDALIPPNVRNAVNFYQTKSFIHGRSRIRASDPKRTNMIGNFHMAYQDRQINCENYSWVARHLNRGHHEIENDPRVWEQISSLIDSELLERTSPLEASLPTFPSGIEVRKDDAMKESKKTMRSTMLSPLTHERPEYPSCVHAVGGNRRSERKPTASNTVAAN